jgi:hypothetical protein
VAPSTTAEDSSTVSPGVVLLQSAVDPTATVGVSITSFWPY